MKTSINAWSCDSKQNFEEMFKEIKKAGFDGIELNVDANDYSAHSLTLNTTDDELTYIKKLSDENNLPIVSISTSLYSNKLGSKNSEDVDYSINLIKKQIYFAKKLGASGILCVPGGITEDNSIKCAYENSYKVLSNLTEYINNEKIYVGLENVWNTFFMSPFDMCSFIDKLNCPYIKAYYDVGNVVAFSWSEYFIELLDNRISHIHVKDFKRQSGVNSGGEFTFLMEGSLNFKKVISALKKAGFDGYLTAEISKPDETESYFEFYKNTAQAINKMINL